MSFFKDFMGLTWIIIVFGLMIFFFLFFTIGFKQIMSENIIAPAVNQTLYGMNASGVSMRSDTEGYITNAQSMYAADWFNADLYFLVFFLTAFIGSVYSAAKLQAPNFYTFWGVSTFGTMFFLFLLTVIGQIREWLLANFYTNVFNLTNISTPIIDWFVNNLQMISFVWFLALLLISFLDWENIIKNITDSSLSNDGEFQK